jgi:hypothetical protein
VKLNRYSDKGNRNDSDIVAGWIIYLPHQREAGMIDSHDEYFRECLAAFPEELFVILRVYADESYAETAEVLRLHGYVS